MSNTCLYCLQPRKDLDGWHGCPQSRDAKARIDASIDAMKRIATKAAPAERKPMTDMEIGQTIRGITFKDNDHAK